MSEFTDKLAQVLVEKDKPREKNPQMSLQQGHEVILAIRRGTSKRDCSLALGISETELTRSLGTWAIRYAILAESKGGE